jgi:hypothetical protein
MLISDTCQTLSRLSHGEWTRRLSEVLVSLLVSTHKGRWPKDATKHKIRGSSELEPLHLGAEGQNRTDDTMIFSHVLYRLSYLGLTQ